MLSLLSKIKIKYFHIIGAYAYKATKNLEGLRPMQFWKLFAVHFQNWQGQRNVTNME